MKPKPTYEELVAGLDTLLNAVTQRDSLELGGLRRIVTAADARDVFYKVKDAEELIWRAKNGD